MPERIPICTTCGSPMQLELADESFHEMNSMTFLDEEGHYWRCSMCAQGKATPDNPPASKINHPPSRIE